MSPSESREENVVSRLSSALADLAAHVAPSIVQVHGRSRRPATGLVVGPERVLAASHSVHWEDGLQVRPDEGDVRAATSLGSDPATDLILLHVPGLSAAPLEFSTITPRIGELALISGRSWRGDRRARLGMVSGLTGPLQVRDGTKLDQLLVLSPSPYPGFSGSAVVGADGALLGMATAGLLRGMALALPGEAVTRLVGEIEQHGGSRRGFLGISSQPVRVPRRQRGGATSDQGLMVLGIVDDSPADRAGLMVGDIMVAAAGEALRVPEDLLALLTPDRIDRTLDIQVLRGGVSETLPVTVGQRPQRA